MVAEKVERETEIRFSYEPPREGKERPRLEEGKLLSTDGVMGLLSTDREKKWEVESMNPVGGW